MNFEVGDLIRIVHPKSLREMNVIGVVLEERHQNNWFRIWVPDIYREMCFDENQMEKIQ